MMETKHIRCWSQIPLQHTGLEKTNFKTKMLLSFF